MEFHFIVFLLILPVICGDGCVTYNFEEGFESFDPTLGTVCASVNNNWSLGQYSSSSLLDRPNPLSETFITSVAPGSCVSSFLFNVENGGVLEVSFYMRFYEFMTISIYNEAAQEMGSWTSSPASITANQWTTVNIPVSTTSTERVLGYLSIFAMVFADETIFVDSFRYIPPNQDAEDIECATYIDENNVVTESSTTENNDMTEATTNENVSSTSENDGTTEASTESESNTTENDGTTEAPTTENGVTTEAITTENDGTTEASSTENESTTSGNDGTTEAFTTESESGTTENGSTNESTSENEPNTTESDGVTEATTAENSGTTEATTTDSSTTEASTTESESNTTENDGITEATTTENDGTTEATSTENESTTSENDGTTEASITESEPDTTENGSTNETESPNETTDSNEFGTTDSYTTDNDFTEPNSGEETTDSPDIDESGSTFWTPFTITLIVTGSFLVLLLIIYISYWCGKRKEMKRIPEILYLDIEELPKPILVPRVKKVYTDSMSSNNPYAKDY